MNVSRESYQVMRMVDTAESAPCEDVGGYFVACLAELRHLVGFDRAAYLTLDPASFGLGIGRLFDYTREEAQLADAYVQGLFRHDPFVSSLACIQRPNEAVIQSRCEPPARTIRAYEDFRVKSGYFHAMASIPFVNGVPLGPLALQRSRGGRDFGEDDRHMYQWTMARMVTRLSHADFLGELHRDGNDRLLFVDGSGRIVYASDAARALCARLAPEPEYPRSGAQRHARLVECRGQTFRVATATVGSANLLAAAGAGHRNGARATAFACRRMSVCRRREARRGFAVSITDPHAVAGVERAQAQASVTDQIDRILHGFALTEAQLRVAKGVLRGMRSQEIAAELGIGVSTVKAHLTKVYAKTEAKGDGSVRRFMAAVFNRLLD